MGRRRKGRSVHGILLLDKSTGSSSNHQLQKARRLFDARKAGHTGSLDPLATGMLPICFGEATKISAWLLDADKIYLTDARLGICTDSADADGRVISEREVPELDDTLVAKAVQKFLGQSQQVPPMYSALKVDGQRLYKLARVGKTVERKSRTITVFDIRVVARQGSLLTLRVQCSKGTYIRTLVEDIGEALGCGAHVETLRRESVSPFGQAPMHSLEDLEQVNKQVNGLDSLLLPMDSALQHLPKADIDATDAALFCQGRSIACPESPTERLPGQPPERFRVRRPGALTMDQPETALAGQLVRVYCDSLLLGVAMTACEGSPEGSILRPNKVFNWQ